MKILKVIHGYPPEYNAGSENYSKTVCDCLSKNHQVAVFTREENPYAKDFSVRKRIENDNLEIFLVNNPQGKDGYRHERLDKVFAGIVEKFCPEIAYIGHLNHLSTGIVDVLSERKIPIVFMLHDFWLMCPRGQFLTRSIGKENDFALCEKQDNEKCACDCYEVYFSGNKNEREKDVAMWHDWIERRMNEIKRIVEKIDLFIAPSRYLLERFANDFALPREKIVYLDYGFPLDYLKPAQRNAKNEPFTFGYIGTHIPAKGVNLLIEAFMKIEKPAALKIFGRDNGQSTKALKQFAENSKNKIEFCGEYENKDLVRKVFNNVDCIVVPSIWAENSPLVIHEAQECKVPVITADVGGMAEYVHHKINGLLFKHRNVDSLAEQMIWAVENPAEMKNFGERGYLFSDDGKVMSVAEHCKKLEEIFQNVLQK